VERAKKLAYKKNRWRKKLEKPFQILLGREGKYTCKMIWSPDRWNYPKVH